jgi:phage shock protein C
MRISRAMNRFQKTDCFSLKNITHSAFSHFDKRLATFIYLSRIGQHNENKWRLIMSEGRLTRSQTDRMLAGVCGGIAAYLGIDSVIVRLLFVLLIFASGIGIPIYLILWFIMPREDHIGNPDANILQENFEEMSHTVSSNVNRVGRPGVIGIILILFGVYFLFDQLNLLGWLGNGAFWPLVIIAFGVYMLVRRSQ